MSVSVHGLGEHAHTEQRDKTPLSDSMYVRHCEKKINKSHRLRGLEAYIKTLGCVSFQIHLTDVPSGWFHRTFID